MTVNRYDWGDDDDDVGEEKITPSMFYDELTASVDDSKKERQQRMKKAELQRERVALLNSIYRMGGDTPNDNATTTELRKQKTCLEKAKRKEEKARKKEEEKDMKQDGRYR